MRIKINISSDFEIVTDDTDNDSKNGSSSGWQWQCRRQWQSWLNIFLLIYFVSTQSMGVFDHHKSVSFRNNEEENGSITEESKQRNANTGSMLRSSYIDNHDNFDPPPPPHVHKEAQQQHEKQQEGQASYKYLDLEPLTEEEPKEMIMERMEKEEQKLQSSSSSKNDHHKQHQQHHGNYYDVRKQQQQQQKVNDSTNTSRRQQQKRRKVEEEERNNNGDDEEEMKSNENDVEKNNEIVGELTMASIIEVGAEEREGDDANQFDNATTTIMEVEREEINENVDNKEIERNEEKKIAKEINSPLFDNGTSTTTNNDDDDIFGFSTGDNGDSSIRRNYNTDAAARLRAALLTGYDKNSFPWEWAWMQNNNNSIANTTGDTIIDTYDPSNRTGLKVEIGLNFHKVFEVDVTDSKSTADLVVWFRLRWKDPRLVWDPKDYGGVDITWFFINDGIGGGEMSEIFTPDIYLWNQAESVQSTFANTYATVTSDGTIFWSRPGRLKATCKFQGLDNFPFDSLSCKLELGSWSRSGLYLRPIKMDGTGVSFGGSDTAGSSFVEFELDNETAAFDKIYPPYPCCPEEDWPVLIYNLIFRRASEPYIRTVILTNIVLNIGAFASFWMSPAAGERMGLAITSVLAAVTSEIIVADRFPRCKEVSWYTRFSMGSLAFAMAVVLESAVVIFFFFYKGDNLKPFYVKWIQNKIKKWKDDKRNESSANNHAKSQLQHDGENNDDSEKNDQNDNNDTNNRIESRDSLPFPPVRKSRSPHSEHGYESSLFTIGENDCNNTHNRTDSRSDPSFWLPVKNAKTFKTLKTSFTAGIEDEFSASFNSVVGQRLVECNKSSTMNKMNNFRWQRVAERIDDVARFIIPLLYVVFLIKVSHESKTVT